MKNRIPFAVIALALVAGLGYFVAGEEIDRQLCGVRNGKWASVDGVCIARTCFKNGSCGSWANPVASCKNLSAGSPRSEVYFQLGMPESSTESLATWSAAKGSDKKITVEFKGDRLASLSCPA